MTVVPIEDRSAFAVASAGRMTPAVGAALAATAASGIFTQDVEDMPATTDPNEEFRRHGWKDREEADEVRTRQAKAIKDGKLAKEFAAWRQQDDVKVPAFSDGWHSKK